jgi:rfaE bifunctional protein kinase chain/domain/rfaE bifunctional protein nucleotidyltransferase chain/domain
VDGEAYKRKIKGREALRDIIGPRPRARRVIMCHGTFDLVHPGHIRHLMYAKSKADILVASLTADIHIKKGSFRPFVPQDLRAMNLAALEVVDYVVVDENETPLENIRYLEPDYFAKGYEYSREGIHPKTQQELAVLESYGGELLFTPGDVVYSSSAIIDTAPPDLAVAKLDSLMEAEGVTFASLREALGKSAGLRVHVVGDLIVDSYTYCSTLGSSTKTPTLSVKYQRRSDFVGGAGIVAKHLKKAGAEVTLTTVLGDDDLKGFVQDDLRSSGVTCSGIVDPTRPTTQKNVFSADGYRLLKVDRLDNRPISEKLLKAFQGSIEATRADVIVFSDFRHGIFNSGTIPGLVGAIPAGCLRIADSQMASRWGNILDFQGFDLITPNEREARFALGDQDSTIRPLALDLYRRARCRVLILKMGARGLITYRAPDPNVRSFFTVDAFAGHVVDPVGAGDALLAYAALSLAATGDPVVASILGSVAAGTACEREGNTPVGAEDVLARLDAVEKQRRHP